MRTSILGLALSLTLACGASGLESMAIGTELAGKGLKAAKEADEFIKRDRPQAAVVVMNRHLNEIDRAIETVKNDAMISESDKRRMLLELQKYRSGHKQDLDRFREYVRLHSEFSER
jgi:hypothetical protein